MEREMEWNGMVTLGALWDDHTRSQRVHTHQRFAQPPHPSDWIETSRWNGKGEMKLKWNGMEWNEME